MAVLTYLWRILESVEHPDLMNLILQYLLALTDPLLSNSLTPRSPAVENRRQTLLSLSQVDGGEDKLNPSFFNMTDLILASVTSKNAETLTAALRLISTLLVKHHPHAYSSLFKVTLDRTFIPSRLYGALQRDLEEYFGLLPRLGGSSGYDEAYDNCVKDALSLIESHACSAARLGMTRGGSALEAKHRSAILEYQSRVVEPHHFNRDDPLINALTALLRTFFTNDIETNLGLTDVLAHLASCPYIGLDGWFVVDPKYYTLNLAATALSSATESQTEDSSAEAEVDNARDPDKAEEARVGAFHAVCEMPKWSTEHCPNILGVLRYLAGQIEAVRPTVPNLDFLLASRKRAFSGLEEMEREAHLPLSAARTPIDSSRPSRDPSRSRVVRPDSSMSNRSSQEDPIRGRSIATIANLQKPNSPSPSRSHPSPQLASRSRPVSPTKLDGQTLSSPAQPNRTLSPLAAVINANEQDSQPLSARSRSSIRSAEAQVLDRKLSFPVQPSSSHLAGGDGDKNVSMSASQGGERTGIQSNGGTEGGDGSVREASLTHVLTNIVILQEFILELMAIIHVRCSLLDGEVKFQ